jgi:hypothetical protein
MIKLASEKSFNRSICPVMNIKGKTVTYPLVVKHNNFHLQCGQGILGPKQMMVMDIIGTKLIHTLYKNKDFSGRIPLSSEKTAKEASGKNMSAKLIKYAADHLSSANQGIISPAWYSPEGKLQIIDKAHPRMKNPLPAGNHPGDIATCKSKYDSKVYPQSRFGGNKGSA